MCNEGYIKAQYNPIIHKGECLSNYQRDMSSVDNVFIMVMNVPTII